MSSSISPDFEWVPEYDQLLEQIASSDSVDSEWGVLRDMITYKIDNIVAQYLQESNPEPPSQPASTPLKNASTNGGLILPPFPPRASTSSAICQTLPARMSQVEVDSFKARLSTTLREFENPPFTIQRICELCVEPRRHYSSVGKYLRALERALLVTSTWDMFPPLSTTEDEYSVNPASASSSSLRDATTPIFSPIPFLHDDARSRSPSPVSIPPAAQVDFLPPPQARGLGLVDELDNPKPGHLSDQPTALSAVTDINALPPLKERFVPSEEAKDSKEPEEDATQGSTKVTELEASAKEDKEVEAMVVDAGET